MKIYSTLKNIRKLQLFGIAGLLLLSSCASYHLRQGNRLFDLMAYNHAIKEYDKALKKKSYPDAKIGIAESYRLTNNTEKAEAAYAEVVQLPEAKPIHKLRYAQLLMRNGKYPSAKLWLENYVKDSANDNAARQLLSSCDSIDALKKDSIRYVVEPLKLNTGQSNFSPVAYKDGIIFASDRKGGASGKTYEWTGQPFLDLYYAKADKDGQLGTPEILKGDVNGTYHDGPVAFGNDTTMYITRDNYLKRKIIQSEDEVTNLKIYQSTRKDTVWSNLKELSFNSNEYSCGHPTLTKDGNTMYFVSDMPGGIGGTDIWMTKKDTGGDWSKPVNLGDKINTPFNEMFPTLYHDSALYFSSQGHENMGGLDLFYSKRDGDQLSDPVNLGYPMNSSHDDFGLLMNEDGKGGYLSSDRANSVQDNIYSFQKRDLRFTVDGIVVEKNSQQPLAGVTVQLINKTTGIVRDSVITGPDGTFFFKLDPESDYGLIGVKENYYTNSIDTTTKGLKKSVDMHIQLRIEMERILVNRPEVLENIYYDLDKSYIRPDAEASLNKLVTLMTKNPGIKIELSSHTDSRSDDRYNMILSQKRAQAAVDYLIAHGINKSRMIAKGYGESRLVNRCKNNAECSEEEHQANRRTEFKVVAIEKKRNM